MGSKRRGITGVVALTVGALVALSGMAAAADGSASEGPGLVPPSEFSGHLDCGIAYGVATIEEMSGLGPEGDITGERLQDWAWRFPVVQISDPRLDGTIVNTSNGYYFSDAAENEAGVYVALWSISNADGAWQGPTTNVLLPESGFGTTSTLLTGSGAYEGLSAFMQADWREDCGWDISGYVLEGDLPQAPELLTP